MKHFIELSIALLVLSLGAIAQSTDSFDIATFTAPSGWTKHVKEGALVFTISDEKKGSFAMLTLYRSGKSAGDAKTDFETDWQEFVAGQLGVKDKPQIEPAKKAEGWELIAGGSPFTSELGPAVVMLNTFSGYGKSFSFASVFNNPDILPAIESFFSSIKLRKPEAVIQPARANDDNSASILGTWGVSHSNQSAFNVNNAVMSYIAREYSFNADGTYRFISRSYDPFSTKILLGKESGTYRISGDLLTIIPKTSVLEGWSKKINGDVLGSRLDSEKRSLEAITYRFTKHYYSGIQKTSLILIADKVTERDGPFSGGTEFPNAWIYSPPCPQCFINLSK